MDPGAAVDLFHGQRGFPGHVDGGAIGGFDGARSDRLRLQGVFPRTAVTDLELAQGRHTAGPEIVTVPQQIGRAAHATGFCRQIAFPAVQATLGHVLGALVKAVDQHGPDRRQAAYARLNIGHFIGPVAPARGETGPAGHEIRAHPLERRGDVDVGVTETRAVIAHQIRMGVATVHLFGLGHRVGETGVDPVAEVLAGRPREHSCRVIVAQGVVGGVQVLPGQFAEILGRGGTGANDERKAGSGGGK